MSIRITTPPASPSSISGLYKTHQIPTPAPDGSQTVFTTLDAYVSGSLNVYRDQSPLLKGASHDFTETTDTTFTVASAPDADEVLWYSCIKK